MAVTISYCDNLCWIDDSSGGGVRELPLDVLRRTTGAVEAAHTAAEAERTSDYLSLPRGLPSGWASRCCDSAAWPAFVAECTESAPLVGGFLALAAAPADLERLRAAALRELAPPSAAAAPPSPSAGPWIGAIAKILGALKRDLVQAHLQHGDDFGAQRRGAFGGCREQLALLGRELDAACGSATPGGWLAAMQRLHPSSDDGPADLFAHDMGCVSAARAQLIGCIQQALRPAAAPPTRGALEQLEAELMPWAAAARLPLLDGARAHCSVALLGLADVFDAPAVQAAIAPVAAARCASGDLSTFCAACQRQECRGARSWQHAPGEVPKGSRQQAEPEQQEQDQQQTDVWSAVQRGSRKTASTVSVSSDDSFFSVDGQSEHDGSSVSQQEHLAGCDGSDDDVHDREPEAEPETEPAEGDGRAEVDRTLTGTSDSVELEMTGSEAASDAGSWEAALTADETESLEVSTAQSSDELFREDDESTAVLDRTVVGAPETASSDGGESYCEVEQDADDQDVDEIGAWEDSKQEDELTRLCAHSEMSLAAALQGKGGDDGWQQQLHAVRRLRKEAIAACYASLSDGDHCVVRLPFVLDKAALARINCESDDDQPASALTTVFIPDKISEAAEMPAVDERRATLVGKSDKADKGRRQQKDAPPQQDDDAAVSAQRRAAARASRKLAASKAQVFTTDKCWRW